VTSQRVVARNCGSQPARARPSATSASGGVEIVPWLIADKTETVTFEPGSVGYREANATHQVASGGPGAMRVIEVELK